MNRIQKISWLIVITIGTAVVLSVITVGLLYYLFGFPVAWAGFGFLGLTGIGGFGETIFKKDPGPVQFDERDHLINLKAARAGFALSYLVFGLLCMGIWGYYHHHRIETISIHILPQLYMAGGIVMFLGHAIMILVLYGRDKTCEGEIK